MSLSLSSLAPGRIVHIPAVLAMAAAQRLSTMSTIGGSGLPSWQGRLARALPQKPVCFTYASVLRVK